MIASFTHHEHVGLGDSDTDQVPSGALRWHEQPLGMLSCTIEAAVMKRTPTSRKELGVNSPGQIVNEHAQP